MRGSPYAGGLRYAPGLDGIRAIAVFAVLLYHARVEWLPGGFLGVDLFLVLSGYLITSLLLAEYRRSGWIDLVRFWAGRARRLLPAATLVIVISLLVVAVFLPADFGRLRVDALTSILYVNNWHQILASHSYFAAFGRPSLLQHYWSLSLEEQFYLVWPLIAVAGLASGRRAWLVLTAACAAVGSAALMSTLYHPGMDPSRLYFGTDTRATPLMIGAILAFGWPLQRMVAVPARGAAFVLDALGIAGLATAVFAMVTWHTYDPFLYRGGFAVVALGAVAAIAVAAHPSSRLSGWLGRRPLRWIGQRSYGIYLWHWPVMALSRPGIDLAWSAWALVPAQLAVTVGLAALSYRYVEMPIRRGEAQPRLKLWLDRRRPRQRLAALTAGMAVVGGALATLGLVPASRSLSVARVSASIAAQRALAAAHQSPAGHSLPARGGGVLAIGASVMLAAAPQLEHRLGARVDAAVGRQPAAIIDRLWAYRRADQLPARVVVQIGDNGPVWFADLVHLHEALRGVPKVVLVNVREPASWQQQVNQQLRHAVHSWPQATLADWLAASAHSRLLYDGAHPTSAGAAVYTAVIARALAR